MAKLTPMKAIRAKCIDCCGGQMYEVRKCPTERCPLWEYRMGHRPGWERKKKEVNDVNKQCDDSNDRV